MKNGAPTLTKGKNYFIRTVTHYYTGKLVNAGKEYLVLTQAAWIADTGRFADFLKSGKAQEIEPYPPGALVYIAVGAVIDVSEWAHELPKEQK